MYTYTLREWIFVFYLYCFLGWVFESCFVSIRQRPLRWVNRGFLRGPFLPLYGSGAVMMLVVSAPFQDNLILTFIAGCIGATVLEYVTGVAMEAMFKVRYWDYSDKKFNVQGHICLQCTIGWGFMTIAMTNILHKPIENLMYALPPVVISLTVFLVTIYLAGDVSLSFREAMDLRDIMIKMEALRGEMEKLQKRLDVIVAVAEEETNLKKAYAEMKLDELSDSLEQKLFSLKKAIVEKPGDYLESVRQEVSEISEKLQIAKYRSGELKLRNMLKRSIIMGNPSMRSANFKKSFEEMKGSFYEKVKDMAEVIKEGKDSITKEK